MAGDWIKVREDLHEDPAVLQMAAELGTRPEHVVGYCVRFWAWASRNCHDGSVTGVTIVSIDSVLNVPGFCALLQKVGWLEVDDPGSKTGQGATVRIPKFERHLSQSAKTRVLNAERQRKKRSRNCHGQSVTGVTQKVVPEKRREEKSNKPLKSPGGHSKDPPQKTRMTRMVYTDQFESFWKAFPGGRKTKKPQSFQKFQRAVASLDRDDAAEWLILRAAEYARSNQGRSKFVRGPLPWLNQEGYFDEPTAWEGDLFSGGNGQPEPEYKRLKPRPRRDLDV